MPTSQEKRTISMKSTFSDQQEREKRLLRTFLFVWKFVLPIPGGKRYVTF
jgi:hypothetical protein